LPLVTPPTSEATWPNEGLDWTEQLYDGGLFRERSKRFV
jgi:hypothetical protein